MANKKIGIAYVPVLLSFTYKSEVEVDAQVAAKELIIELMSEWEGTTFGMDTIEFDFNSLDWLRGNYLDQVQEVEVEEDDGEQPEEETKESSSADGW
jgi:hypothetical protein